MPASEKLLLVYEALYLVGEAIRLVKLALDNGPSPDDELHLRSQLSDLQTLKDELIALKNSLVGGGSFAAPPPALMNQIAGLIGQVEQARLNGAAAGASMALAGQVLGVALEVMSAAIEA